MRPVLLPGLVLAAVATGGAVLGQRGQVPAGIPGGSLASSPGAAAVRRILVQALGRSADPTTLDPLIGHLDDPDLTVRREAAFALAQRFFHTPPGPESAAARTGIMVRLNPARHERGTVALATNGRDTGIGQFFINLVDTPAFDHEYTVFGRVICVKPARPGPYVTGHPMDVIERIVEGDRILHIRFPARPLELQSFRCVPGIQ